MDMSATRQLSDSDEEEEIEDQTWDDWQADVNDIAMDEQDPNSELLCLFCDSRYDSSSLLFEHCASAHQFDFQEIRKAYSLDFYKCFKLINYIRSQVTANKSWSFAEICSSDEKLRGHGQTNNLPWDDDKYLNPFLEDDAVLYSFDDDDEDDSFSIDPTEPALSQFEHLKIDEGCSSMHTSECDSSTLENGCQNGAKVINYDQHNGTDGENQFDRLIADDVTDISNGALALKRTTDKKRSASYSRSSPDDIERTNKSYFSSYSSFGSHRDMISDKVRTDAYREAILDNPSLLRGAVVMDIGCGTGILSLFAAQAGASSVFAVDASEKMAAVATQVAKDNGLLYNVNFCEGHIDNGVIQVVQGMIEEIGASDSIQPQSIDVLVSEWMGYCLLYESMLSSVIFARDRWLKPGGAILPDTATMFVAGFGKGGTSTPFWENVYGFDMSCIGWEVVEDAAKVPIVDVIESCNIVTTTEVLQSFDLATMQPKQMDFTAEIELQPKPLNQPPDTKADTNRCYGVVVWFDTGFSERFCKEKPVVLSTSPYGPSTHWSQTVLTFRDPIAIASDIDGKGTGKVGTDDCPAARIRARMSVVRASQHRSIDISLELTAIGPGGQKQDWPAQLFHLN